MSTPAQKANRILTMIPIIRNRPGIKITELAKQLGVTERTIMTDLDSILMCGVPPYLPNDYIGVYVDPNQGVQVQFADQFTRPVSLTYMEALSLRLALENVPAVKGGGARRLAAKLDQLLPKSLRSGKRFRTPGPPGSMLARIQTLERATLERREADIEYYTASRDEMTRRVVRPYALIEHQGYWYVVAFCTMRKRELPFRVDRIKCARLMEERFEVPPDFDIAKYRRPAMYLPSEREVTVRVRVTPEAVGRFRFARTGGAASAGSEGMPSIKDLRHMKDGSAEIALSVSRPKWLISWALQHTDSVEILSPPELREEMRTACESLLDLYE
jgi:proteasome accessory factor C